jgi:hypothetical protein
MEDLDRTKPPIIKSKGTLLVKAKDGHPAQPIPPEKRIFAPEPEIYRKRMRGSMKDLVLGAASQSGQSLEDAFVVRHESPWETFLKVYDCELPGLFDVAIRRVRPKRLVALCA